MAAKKTKVKPIPFETLVDRKRKGTFLLRLNDEELLMLQELSAIRNVSRSNVMRMLLKQGHAEIVEKPFREQAEVDVASAAAHLAVDERINALKKELLARINVSNRKKAVRR